MKYIFLGCFLALIVAWLGTWLTEPDMRSELPVIYWVRAPGPVCPRQIALFHHWQIKNDHNKEYALRTMQELKSFRKLKWTPVVREAIEQANPDGWMVWNEATGAADLPIAVRVPVVELRQDADNTTIDKKLIQGLSGVAGDIIDTYGGGGEMRYLVATGMVVDLTESAARLGFDLSHTYPGLAPGMLVDGRQYGFPRIVSQKLLWVNKATFRKYNQPLPPRRWTIEEFERRGKAFAEATKPTGKHRRVFFASRLERGQLLRSMGLSNFNETMTRCTLDDPRYVRMLKLVHRWMYKDHILPTAGDLAEFADHLAGSGSNEPASFQLFYKGNYAMHSTGRWALMLFRMFGTMELAVVEPPHAGFPNTRLSGGATTLYKNSPHRKLAELFFVYLASEEFNMQIVRDGDGLPPNPKYTDNELFRRPPDYPNEWGCHEVYSRTARELGIAGSFSPFVLPGTVGRITRQIEEGYLASEHPRRTAEESAELAARRINEEIQRTLKERPKFREKYEKLCAAQEKIDQYRKTGKKVPLEWITNPFHKRYYASKGWGEEK